MPTVMAPPTSSTKRMVNGFMRAPATAAARSEVTSVSLRRATKLDSSTRKTRTASSIERGRHSAIRAWRSSSEVKSLRFSRSEQVSSASDGV